MGPFTALMTVDHAVTNVPATPRAGGSWIGGVIGKIRRQATDRRLRDQLAGMDDAMLRDIGIAPDEIHMIRARDRFTPRAWAARGLGHNRWDV